jgi:Ca2+-binding EF-hand superfamily protein
MKLLGGDQVSSRKWEKALREADTNRDGKIDLHEFKGIFRQMVAESRGQL